MKFTAGYRRRTDKNGGSGRSGGENRTAEERIFFFLGCAAIALSLALPLGGESQARTEEPERPPAVVAVMNLLSPDGPGEAAGSGSGEIGETAGQEAEDGREEETGSRSNAGQNAGQNVGQNVGQSIYDRIGLFFARIFTGILRARDSRLR